jgi:hypothetical protein
MSHYATVWDSVSQSDSLKKPRYKLCLSQHDVAVPPKVVCKSCPGKIVWKLPELECLKIWVRMSDIREK